MEEATVVEAVDTTAIKADGARTRCPTSVVVYVPSIGPPTSSNASKKNFYVEDKRVTARSDRDIDEFRRAKEMKVPPFFLLSFSFFSFSSFRFKVATFPGPSLPLKRQASQSTSCPPSVHKALQAQLQFSARRGQWLLAVVI